VSKPAKIDFSKLFGFASVSDRIKGSVDFQDEAVSTLGAKVGPPEIIAPKRVKAPDKTK
jgi:hypothetical protein